MIRGALAVLALLALAACGRPTEEPPQGDEAALEDAIEAPQQRARAVEDQVQAASRRSADAAEEQGGD